MRLGLISVPSSRKKPSSPFILFTSFRQVPGTKWQTALASQHAITPPSHPEALSADRLGGDAQIAEPGPG
jgi:hypothetical protein